MTFHITKDSTLPYLRMEVINDGRHDFRKLYYAMQSAIVTFSMVNAETGVKKVANAKAYVVSKENLSCSEGFVIEYRWNKRDTNTAGLYKGQFRIKFDGTANVNGMTFPTGEMNVPIAEELNISISDNII